MNNYLTNEFLLQEYLDNPLLEYLIKKCPGLSRDDVIIRVCEVLKFLYFGHYASGNIPFDNEIDEIWHLLILQTKQYQQLSEKLPHKKFIHHSSNAYDPAPKLTEEQINKEKNRQISYLVSYVYNFGPISEQVIKFYDMGLKLFKMCNNDIDKLNEYLFNLGSKFKVSC